QLSEPATERGRGRAAPPSTKTLAISGSLPRASGIFQKLLDPERILPPGLGSTLGESQRWRRWAGDGGSASGWGI
uniref:Uncharacterized protein n=1 Tax=Oryza meridionalis TaxID=40149 RepID=A0A0E0CVP8_9ORYZ